MKTISGRKILWQVVVVVAVSILWTWGMVGPDEALAATDACKLLSAGEIEAVIGEKVNIPPGGPGGSTSMCLIMGGIYKVMVNFEQVPADSGTAVGDEKAVIEMNKKVGIKVTFDKNKCSTSIPSAPPKDPRSIMGYMTSCPMVKGKVYVSVSVIAPSEAKMVPPAKVRSLAEKAAARL